jgi:GAF domain-containing protein
MTHAYVKSQLVKRWLTSLPARIVEGLLVLAIATYGGFVLSDAPVWTTALAVLVIAPLCYVAGSRRERGDLLDAVHAEHIREVLEVIQKVLAGDLPGIDTDSVVERGILGPARYCFTRGTSEDVRLTVIAPEDSDSGTFHLIWECGHSIEAREKFSLSVAGSFAGFAYTSGETQWTNDVAADKRWTSHPKARKARAYGSLASVPIRQGSDVMGVLNVLSTRTGAFTTGDLRYIEIMGSLINVVWGVANSDEDPGDESADEHKVAS